MGECTRRGAVRERARSEGSRKDTKHAAKRENPIKNIFLRRIEMTQHSLSKMLQALLLSTIALVLLAAP